MAGRTAVLLRNTGYKWLAGGIDVEEIANGSPFAGDSREHLLAGSEATVARGYGLRPDDLEIVRRDFTAQGFPGPVFDLACEILATAGQMAAS